MSLKRSLYTLLLYLVFPLILIRLLLRSRSNQDYRKRWSERLGLVKAINHTPVIWIHAVSVGEAIAVKPLVESLLNTYPDSKILITTTTPTGSDRVSDMFVNHIQQKKIIHTYFPYDLLGVVSRFVNAFKPQILIVVETEIWPNLYAKCHQKGIPVVMVNARLSKKSTQSYLKIKSLVAETLSYVSVIAVRSETDAQRFSHLGAKSNQIQEVGNIKYDIRIDRTQADKAAHFLKKINTSASARRLVYVAASTHQGEDVKVLFSYLNLLKHFPELLLVLVPRHPERFNDVYIDCIEQLPKDINIIKYSQSEDYSNLKDINVNVILGDSMGEMQMWFASADVVFMGGSLVETGGHNPLEATLYGVPTFTGPHMFNFEDIATELSAAELLVVCDDEFDLSIKLKQLLTEKKESLLNDSSAKLYKIKSEDFMRQHQGVTSRLVNIISGLLSV